MKINLKTSQEIEIMAEGGEITGRVLKAVLKKAKPGTATIDLDSFAEKEIRKMGGKPSFKMVNGYKFATCMSVNEAVVHGLPSEYRLENGDILGVDLGVYYKGFHTDAAWTLKIQNSNQEVDVDRFLKTGEIALDKAIERVQAGKRMGDISLAIQKTIEGAGYSVARNLVGHGVGRKLHEDPEVPCFLQGKIEETPRLEKGMVLAIEVIYNQGGQEAVQVEDKDDSWTIITADGSLSACFEETVAITSSGPRVLTVLR